tara:strand:- start:761 stop:1126 length:366 start_codon:yes stop_codon:yes gene_type:complete
MTALENFTKATIEALYFTETGDLDQPTSDAKLSPDNLAHLQADCASFWYRFGGYVETAECNRGDGSHSKASQAGHDFWLTRQGHGAGFWDGDWSEPFAKLLSAGSECYGEFYPEFIETPQA